MFSISAELYVLSPKYLLLFAQTGRRTDATAAPMFFERELFKLARSHVRRYVGLCLCIGLRKKENILYLIASRIPPGQVSRSREAKSLQKEGRGGQ